jgi:hypothetical protein
LKPPKPPQLLISEILERVGDVTRRRSNVDIAADLGCADSSVSNWKARGTIPWEALYRFAHEHGVPFEWLLSGLGTKEDHGTAPAEAIVKYEKLIKRYERVIDKLCKDKKT